MLGTTGGTVGTLGDVIAHLRGVLDQCGQARNDLNQAADLLEEANVQYAHAMDGAHDPGANEALGLLARSIADLNETYRALTPIEDQVQGYATGLAGTTSTVSAAMSERNVRPAQPPPDDIPVTPTRDRIEQLRAELPPPVAPRSGQKTHGRWIGPDGKAHSMVSGNDEAYDETIQVFKEMKSRHIPQRASDVEMKLAAHMRRNGIRSATLIINNTPCRGPMSCNALVSVILPKGYTLTVYGTNGFKRDYPGGGTSSWVP